MSRPAGNPGSAHPIDAVVDALDDAQAEALLAELLTADGAAPDPLSAKPREIKERVKALAARDPALLARIITYWMREERGGRGGR